MDELRTMIQDQVRQFADQTRQVQRYGVVEASNTTGWCTLTQGIDVLRVCVALQSEYLLVPSVGVPDTGTLMV